MFYSLFKKEYRQTDLDLKNLNIVSRQADQHTKFKDLYLLVKNQIVPKKTINNYIELIRNQNFNLHSLLKSSILVHLYLQEASSINQTQIMQFFSNLLPHCQKLQAKYSQIECKNLNKMDKSISGRSTKSQDLPMCKQNHIIINIVRPYLAYLMKRTATFDRRKKIDARQRVVQQHQIWQIINFLKSIASIASSFVLVGRYWKKHYGSVIVLLSKVLTHQVSKWYAKLSFFLSNSLKNDGASADQKQKAKLVILLDQITQLKEALLVLYLSRYFAEELSMVFQPQWITNSTPQFELLFQLSNTCGKAEPRENRRAE